MPTERDALNGGSDWSSSDESDALTMPVKVDQFKFPLTAWPLILFEVVFAPLSFSNAASAVRWREAIGTQFVYRFWKAVLVIHAVEVSYMLYLCRKHKTSLRIGSLWCAGAFIVGFPFILRFQSLVRQTEHASDRSPALSAASLGTITRSVSPALTTSSGSTIKASRLNRSGQLTPAPSEYGTPVLTSRNLPDDPEPSSSSSKSLGKRISAMSIEDDELSTPVKNTGRGLFGGLPSSSSSTTMPSSPAAERHPKINTAEREWEASIRDAQRKKALLEQAQAAYDEAVALEKAMFKTYSKLRMNLDT
ncbi:hypothetical protein FRB90_010123 [Tulasnella sp. 427]|nr:hypothetical protein FRB90_010123 [Tulasnella sp. 427]